MSTISYKHIPLFMLVVAISLYVFFNTRELRHGPVIEIMYPQNFSTVPAGITVHGRVPHAKGVLVNGQSVYITSEGEFTSRVLLSPPLDTLYIEAMDSLGTHSSTTLRLRVAQD